MAPRGRVIELQPLLNAVSLSHRRWILVFRHSHEIEDYLATYFIAKTWDMRERRFPVEGFLPTLAHHFGFGEYFQGFIFHSTLTDTPEGMYYQSRFSEMKRVRQNGEVVCS